MTYWRANAWSQWVYGLRFSVTMAQPQDFPVSGLDWISRLPKASSWRVRKEASLCSPRSAKTATEQSSYERWIR